MPKPQLQYVDLETAVAAVKRLECQCDADLRDGQWLRLRCHRCRALCALDAASECDTED